MGRLVADVSRRNHPIGGQLTLIADVPLLHIGGQPLRWERQIGAREKRYGRGRDNGDRERVTAGKSLVGIGKAAHRGGKIDGACPGRVLTGVSVVEGLGRVIKDAIPNPDRLFAVAGGVPNQSEAGLQIGESAETEGIRRIPRVANVEHAGRRVHEHLAPRAGQERRGRKIRASNVM